jgi:cytochrome c1
MTVRSSGISLAVLSAGWFCALLLGCDESARRDYAKQMVEGGDPDRGEQLIRYYGCTSCHQIPGIHGANGLVGPPLDHMASRTYVGGVIQNTPRNMVAWIQDPKSIDQKSAMPNVHVSDQDAKDIACYLYTLR